MIEPKRCISKCSEKTSLSPSGQILERLYSRLNAFDDKIHKLEDQLDQLDELKTERRFVVREIDSLLPISPSLENIRSNK
jgi:hypothetical protein